MSKGVRSRREGNMYVPTRVGHVLGCVGRMKMRDEGEG